METNKIYLNFSKTIYGLAGYDYGVEVYKKQIEPQMDYCKRTEIVFPESIEIIASSFIQGMFATIIEKVGYKGIKDMKHLEAALEDGSIAG